MTGSLSQFSQPRDGGCPDNIAPDQVLHAQTNSMMSSSQRQIPLRTNADSPTPAPRNRDSQGDSHHAPVPVWSESPTSSSVTISAPPILDATDLAPSSGDVASAEAQASFCSPVMSTQLIGDTGKR